MGSIIPVAEHTTTLDQVPVFYRSAGDGEHPILYLHGAPTSSDDWVDALARTGGFAPDLPGFGRSGKGGHLDYTPPALAAFIGRFLDELSADRVSIVAHDWGAAPAVMFAAGAPERVAQLVLVNAVPLFPGQRWHRLARIWRTPGIGELAMGATTKLIFSRRLRRGSVSRDAWSDARVRASWEHFDQGTQRTVLRLHRWASEANLERTESLLGDLPVPTLILWGDRDPWFAPQLADACARRLPHASAEHIAQAGHWPWLDDPGVIDRIAARCEP